MTIAAVASAKPSMMPTVIIEAPSVVTMNTGNRLWISSDEMSMNSEPKPRAQMPAGKARHVEGVALVRICHGVEQVTKSLQLRTPAAS